MRVNSEPIFGFRQPTLGSALALTVYGMDRKTRTPKTPGYTRTILSANVIALLEHHYGWLPNITSRQRELAKDSRGTLKFSTIQRICKEAVGANVETLEHIATRFDLAVYQLFIPELAPANPQIVKGADKAEKAFYMRFKRGGLRAPLDSRLPGPKERKRA